VVLLDPDLVVEYNWNLRVPTCAGVSCETASCSTLENKLQFYDINEFECNKHRKGLQQTAGCNCAENKDNNGNIGNNGDVNGNNGDRSSNSSGSTRWILISVSTVVYFAIGLWVGI